MWILYIRKYIYCVFYGNDVVYYNIGFIVKEDIIVEIFLSYVIRKYGIFFNFYFVR